MSGTDTPVRMWLGTVTDAGDFDPLFEMGVMDDGSWLSPAGQKGYVSHFAIGVDDPGSPWPLGRSVLLVGHESLTLDRSALTSRIDYAPSFMDYLGGDA